MASLSMSSRGSVDRAPARCSGGHGFNSCRGLRFFSLSHARVIVDYFIFQIFIVAHLFFSAGLTIPERKETALIP